MNIPKGDNKKPYIDEQAIQWPRKRVKRQTKIYRSAGRLFMSEEHFQERDNPNIKLLIVVIC